VQEPTYLLATYICLSVRSSVRLYVTSLYRSKPKWDKRLRVFTIW